MGNRSAFILYKGILQGLLFVILVVMLLPITAKQAMAASYGYDLPEEFIPEEGTDSIIRDNILSFENEKVEAGVPLKVKGAPRVSTYCWKITSADGSAEAFTTEDNSYTPLEADKEKLITVTVEGLDGAEASIYYSSLPVIYINNADGYYGVREEYSPASMSMQGNETFQKEDQFYTGDIAVRLRGNSTKWRDKRPFNIKLDSKSDLLGMGKNKHWALLANDIDHTLMRNKLLYDFSGAIGMDVYSKSENVVLIFNNQYYGVYQLCEQVDLGNERIDIYDWEESAEKAAETITDKLHAEGKISDEMADITESNLEDAMCLDMSWISAPYTFTYDADQDGTSETYHISDYTDLPEATGGVLLEMDFFAYDGHNPSTMITNYSQPIYFKSPEHAITNTALFNYTRKYLQAFEYSLHSTDFIYHENDRKFLSSSQKGGRNNSAYLVSSFTAPEYDGKHYSELFDLDSLVQNFIVCEYSMNWDGMKNSVFMYKDIDGLFHMGPEWDFDWAWGNINMYGINTWYPTSWHTTEEAYTVEQYYQTVQWNRNLIRDPYFLVRVYEKYKEIRSTAIEDMIKSGGTIDTYAAELKEAAAANDARWQYSYDDYKSVGFEGSLTNMKDFIHTRVIWMDEQFTSLDSFIASLGYYKPSPDLSVAKVETKYQEGYTEITAAITGSDIAYVTFQVNGIHQYTTEVKEGKAICEVPDSDLIHKDDKWNVVQILAKDANNEYIIDTMEAGNYYNAKSNYAVFYYKEENNNLSGSSSCNTPDVSAVTDSPTSISDASKDSDVKEAMAQPAKQQGEYVAAISIAAVIIVLLLISCAAVLHGKNQKRN